MRITVFGGTGGTGRHIITQACDAGHEVTAVVRDPARLEYQSPQLSMVTADVMDPAAIRSAIAGRDAVITAIGSRQIRKPTTIQTDSTASIIEAMNDTGVRRLVVVSNSGMVTDGDGPFVRWLVKPIIGRILRHPWNDMRDMEEVVRASAVDWTIVRPPQLTDGPRTATYRTATNVNLRGGNRASRANVADCVVKSLDDASSIGNAISVAN